MAQTKSLSKLFNIEVIEKMLHHFEIHNFTKTINNEALQFGFVIENLKEFAKKEWLLSNLISSDCSAFLFGSLKTKENIKTAFEDVKNFVHLTPFSLVEVDSSYEEKKFKMSAPKSALNLVRHQFKNKSGTVLRNQTFCPPSDAAEIFYKKQRDRKAWWRKFSASPGRFVTSVTNSTEHDKSMVCEVQAEFPWGSETVETIKLLPDFCNSDKEFFEVKMSKRKKCTPQVVMCETILENMAFTYLCDSYEKLNGENERDVLRFNKKLAPFKVSMAGTCDSSEAVKSLEELSLLLTKQMRKLGLTVLFLPDACTSSVERQLLRNDALGVPYTVLLNENTLKDGTIELRNRDTILKEHSHVSLIVQYLDKIFK